MKSINLNDIQESKEYSKPTAGGYICRITKVEDRPQKEYLYIEYDIADGDLEGYYKHLHDRLDADWWGAHYIRSYKPKALPFFKRMCSAVSKSNGNFVFDAGAINNDESTLTGKLIGLILQEEEYIGNDGAKKTRVNVYREVPIGVIKSGKFKVPAPKTLPDGNESTSNDPSEFVDIPSDTEEVPFA